MNEKTNYVKQENYADNMKAETAGAVMMFGGLAAALAGSIMAGDAYVKARAGAPDDLEYVIGCALVPIGTIVVCEGGYLTFKEKK